MALLCSGCSYEYLDCDVDYLLPGMWSGPVDLDVGVANISIHASIHVQLYPDGDDHVVGWAYFTDGEVDASGFPNNECWPISVSGEIVPSEDGIRVDCLLLGDGGTCVSFHGTEEGADFSVSYSGFSQGAHLSGYESLGERGLEDFQCLE